MAENIEELKQTIDSVITSNGNGQITGQGLNLVLNDMCNVLGSTGGGGNSYKLFASLDMDSNITNEQKDSNAQQFINIVEKIQLQEPINICIYAGDYILFPMLSAYSDMGDGTYALIFYAFVISNAVGIALLPDGSIQIAG